MSINSQTLIDYEEGKLDEIATIELFQDLINSGLAWELQGHYGRAAATYLRHGLCSQSGVIETDPDDEIYAMYGIDDGPNPYYNEDDSSLVIEKTLPMTPEDLAREVGAVWSQEPE